MEDGTSFLSSPRELFGLEMEDGGTTVHTAPLSRIASDFALDWSDGMKIWHGRSMALQRVASATPVLPDVPSATLVQPDANLPFKMLRAIRSFDEPEGFELSSFT